jgi:1-acyl-sn-glycerol-3-phosphate acyltransferase
MWFYVLFTIPIVMLPFLVASIVSEKGYPYYFKMARIWAKFILFGMGFYYKIEKSQVLEPDKSYMIVSTSMTDIMLIFCWKSRIKQDTFIWIFYKRTCILVDRGCSKAV